MALVTPVGVAIPAFDATQPQTFSFTVQGGDQVVGNILTIIDNTTGDIVDGFPKRVESYVYSQSIPANVLENDKYYAFYFQTINVYGDISNKSANVTFRTYTSPTLIFTNIPSTNVIESGSYTFQCTYDQIEGELLDTLYFYLYDARQQQIKVSPVYTSTSSPPLFFAHQFNGFTDDERYYVRAIATTIYGTIVDTGFVEINVNYSYEGAYLAVTATNNPLGGYVQISNNISEIDGQVYDRDDIPTDPIFLDGNSLLLDNKDHLVWSRGFSFANTRFTKQRWWQPLWWGKQTKLSNYSTLEGHEGDGNSYIEVEFCRGIPDGETTAKDYLVARGFVDGEQYFTKVSNFIEPLNNLSHVTSILWVNDGEYDLVIEKMRGGSLIVWDGESNVEYGNITDILWVGESSSASTNLLNFDGESNVEFNKITDLFWDDEPQEIPVQEHDNLSPAPSTRYITNVRLDNAIVKDFYITHDVSKPTWPYDIPPWDNYTIMRATFEDNSLKAGNVEWLLNKINNIKIKRRKVGAHQDWITLYTQPIQTEFDLSFYYRDYYCPSGYQFEYAMVPAVDVEEQAYFTTVVKTYFDGLFISDKNKTMKLYSNYLIGQSADNILLGQLQPYNQRYPVIIKNPNVQYRTVTLQGDVLGLSDSNCQIFELNKETRPIIVDQKTEWDNFLCDGKAKIIKDWNGNILLGKITTAPTYTYDKTSGNSKPTLTFGATEVGQYDSQWYMYHHGLIDVEST